MEKFVHDRDIEFMYPLNLGMDHMAGFKPGELHTILSNMGGPRMGKSNIELVHQIQQMKSGDVEIGFVSLEHDIEEVHTKFIDNMKKLEMTKND